MISVVVPVGKEGEDLYDRIILVYRELKDIMRKNNMSFEVLLVSDVPHQLTLKAMKKLSERGIARSLFLTKRIGKGGSVKNAIPYISGDYVVLLDADIPVSVKTIYRALLVAIKLKADMVIANRVYKTHGLIRRALSATYNMIVNFLFKTNIKDHQAGFKVISREVATDILLKRVRTDGFAYDTELIVWAKRYRLKLSIIDVIWRERRDVSTIPPLRTLLTMLTDLIILKLMFIKNSITLKRVCVGAVIDLASLRVIGREYTTEIEASGVESYVLRVLRKLYIAVAFKNN